MACIKVNEAAARVYADTWGIGSIGLRPFIVYGPGRDQGLTSATTVAMLAAAGMRRYRIPFGGTRSQYAPDVARTFIDAARAAPHTAEVFNIGGAFASVREVISSIEAVEPAALGMITYDDAPFSSWPPRSTPRESSACLDHVSTHRSRTASQPQLPHSGVLLRPASWSFRTILDNDASFPNLCLRCGWASPSRRANASAREPSPSLPVGAFAHRDAWVLPLP